MTTKSNSFLASPASAFDGGGLVKHFSRRLFVMIHLGLCVVTIVPIAAQAVAVVPNRSGTGPIGILVRAEYQRFTNRSLLQGPVARETPQQRLVRRYAQSVAAKDKAAVLQLYS